jgi:hypothetical protein
MRPPCSRNRQPFPRGLLQRPHRFRAAGAAVYLLNRHRQQLSLRQADLFSQTTVCDYVFDKDKIFAYLNLDDNELFIYQRLYDLLARDIASPDLVVYLQARPTISCGGCAIAPARTRVGCRPGGRLPARAQRGLSAFLLSLHRHAAPRRRHLPGRVPYERSRPRRLDPSDPDDGPGDDVLRAAELSRTR